MDIISVSALLCTSLKALRPCLYLLPLLLEGVTPATFMPSSWHRKTNCCEGLTDGNTCLGASCPAVPKRLLRFPISATTAPTSSVIAGTGQAKPKPFERSDTNLRKASLGSNERYLSAEGWDNCKLNDRHVSVQYIYIQSLAWEPPKQRCILHTYCKALVYFAHVQQQAAT